MNLTDVRKRLSKLEGKEDLEKLLANEDEGLPWHDFVWMLQFPAYVGAAIQVTVSRSPEKPANQESRPSLVVPVLPATLKSCDR